MGLWFLVKKEVRTTKKKARKAQTVAEVEELVVGSELGVRRGGREALQHVCSLAEHEHRDAAQVQHGWPHLQFFFRQTLLFIILVFVFIILILIIFLIIVIVIITFRGNDDFGELGHGILDLLHPELDLLHDDLLVVELHRRDVGAVLPHDARERRDVAAVGAPVPHEAHEVRRRRRRAAHLLRDNHLQRPRHERHCVRSCAARRKQRLLKHLHRRHTHRRVALVPLKPQHNCESQTNIRTSMCTRVSIC